MGCEEATSGTGRLGRLGAVEHDGQLAQDKSNKQHFEHNPEKGLEAAHHLAELSEHHPPCA